MSDVQNKTGQVEHMKEALHGVEREYTHGEDVPVRGYVGAMAAYGTVVSVLAVAAKLTRRPIPTPSVWDVALCAGATHRLSRLLARDPVTSPLRAPFTRFEGTQGPAELREEVRGTGVRKTIGELVTCPFCTGMWISTALTGGLVFAPAVTRLAAGGLTALTVSDYLQFAHSRLAG